MTDQDWDEVFADLVSRVTTALEAGVRAVDLASIALETPVGFYDLRALCRERTDGLASAGLTLDPESLTFTASRPSVAPPAIEVDGQVILAYTLTGEQRS